MTKRKNVDGVLDALAAAKELSFRYTVIGQGDDCERLIAHAARLGLADRVSFPGRVPDEALREAYAAADLFVMPVHSDGRDVEGFGMVFTEAAAYGTPSLATRHGGIPDAILEGVSGMLLDTADPAAITKGLRTFSLNRAAFDPAKIRAFARTFGIDHVAPKVEQVLIEAAA
jgi:phosphatidylinositol alpha-1,6-mannosyltransferase